MQRAGFSSERDAAEALGRAQERLRREQRVSRSLTLAELVEAQRPFESWPSSTRSSRISPRYGLMVIFPAATGLRPAEWLTLERRDVDPEARVVYVRRSFTDGR
jgi:integrase